MENKRALVVGAGFAGGVVARELAEAGWKVLVIDKRNHIAGNAYDYINELGIRVHQYGPHLWHGNSDAAQEWASQFTEWVPYKHWVEALLPNGKHVPLPINSQTIKALFFAELRDFIDCGNPATQDYWGYNDEEDNFLYHYSNRGYEAFLESKRENINPEDITNSREHVEASVGKELCELFFAPYTKKMWGMDLADLPASVAARIPTKLDMESMKKYGHWDKYYFPKDKYQCLPAEGYTKMFERIFDHENITVKLCTSREELPQYAHGGYTVILPGDWNDAKFDEVFTAEPIDTYYKCDLGELPWRSIKCHVVNVPLPQALPAPVVNFTHDGPFTRVTEWKQLPAHGSNPFWTTLTFEEPCDYKDNNMERYYPVKTSHAIDPHRELYKKYRARAQEDGVHFIGRCGRYTYTDMIPCVNSTLSQVRKFLAGESTQLEE